MSTLQTCLNYLNACEVRYTHTSHPFASTAEDVAEAENMPPHRVAKTVVCQSEDGHLMVVVPANSYVDMDQLRAGLGTDSVIVVPEKDLRSLFTGTELGAMPALGTLFDLPVYLDRELANEEFLAFNAGTHRDVIHMRTADFLRLIRPVVGDFSRPKERLRSGFIPLHAM